MPQAKQTKKQSTQQDFIDHLTQRITHLELALAKLATLTGNANMLHEFKLHPWQPTPKDMSKIPPSL